MGLRVNLQAILETLLGTDKVFFQAPNNTAMQYPCIVYEIDRMSVDFADNNPYRLLDRYQVTVISRDPDTVIRSKVAALPMTLFNRFYVVNNLNHYVFNLYY